MGDVAAWAREAGVDTSTRIPGYWQHHDGNTNLKKSSSPPPLIMGEPPRAGERYVLLHLHGGGYVVESAHPTNGTSSIPRAIMAYAPSIYRALAPEYRKAKKGDHPFPAQLIDALAAIGVTPEDGQVIGAPQGYAMMNAIKTAERKLANGTLWHDGSALMAWCVGNIKIEPTATAIRATKANAGDAKIDPAMALFDAVTVMSRNPEAKGEPAFQMMIL